jgi:hypothetical protein
MGNRQDRRARRDAKNREQKTLIDEPKTGHQEDGTDGQQEIVDIGSPDQPRRKQPTKEGDGKNSNSCTEAKNGGKVVRSFVARQLSGLVAFLDRHGGSVGSVSTLVSAIGTVAIVVLTCFYVSYSRKANDITMESLQVSQRAYITIGRRDGTVADFDIPKDPGGVALVNVYFQNTGHIPAQFSWGTTVPALTLSGPSGINFTQPFTYFVRTKQHGAIHQSGTSVTVAGDSVFAATIGYITQDRLAALKSGSPALLILGMFQYCDELGTNITQSFSLTYQHSPSSPNLTFMLSSDYEIPAVPRPHATADIEYLPPCKTISEREKERDTKP